jgi:hypothetical protein
VGTKSLTPTLALDGVLGAGKTVLGATVGIKLVTSSNAGLNASGVLLKNSSNPALLLDGAAGNASNEKAEAPSVLEVTTSIKETLERVSDARRELHVFLYTQGR